MKRKAMLGTALGLFFVLLLVAGCSTQPPVTESELTAPARPAYQPAISINDVMVSVVDHNAHMLWNVAIEGRAPRNDSDWHNLEHAADTMTAAGGMISIGGSGPNDAAWVADPAWQMYSQQMANAGLEMSRAVDERKVDALVAAGDLLVASCEGCHMQFKTEIPAHIAGAGEQPEHYGHE